MLGRHAAGGLPPPEMMRRCVRSLLAFQQDELLDDVTLLLVEWRSPFLHRLLP
jgi:serine phosphatase RsbU (regulator of sigma subunit)